MRELLEQLSDVRRRVSRLETLEPGGGYVATLGDVGEGTWTPTIWDATSGGNQGTASSAVGLYYKIGKFYKISCVLVNIDTTGMTAGNVLYIRGLPAPSKSTSLYRESVMAQVNRVTFSGYVQVNLINNVSYVNLLENVSGADAANLTVSDYTSGQADVIFSMSYWTD